MNNEITKESGIKWGPFRLRIPFVHMKFLTGEFLQGLIISGATALAGAPVVMALGLSFEQAVACCFIASILIIIASANAAVPPLLRTPFISLKCCFALSLIHFQS